MSIGSETNKRLWVVEIDDPHFGLPLSATRLATTCLMQGRRCLKTGTSFD